MKNKILLIAIILLAAFLRLWALSSYPIGLNADEAALGYNAYSLLTTGKDEHGHPWPVNLESFGDFKPALYAYILIPFVKVLGLTELAVRLPSAIFGIVSVALIYFLVREIYEKNSLALMSALILAVNPWALHFSRGAWETNLATCLMILGVWSFIRWKNTQKSKLLFLSVFSLVLSLYSYQSARVIAPLLGLGLVVLNFRKLLSLPKKTLISLIIFTVLMLAPLAVSVISSDAASRFSGVGLLADEGPLNRVKEFRGQHPDPSGFLPKFLHNRPVIYTIQFMNNYLSHFSGDFLFVNGDAIERNRIPETGLFYLFDFLFLIPGAIYIARNRNSNTKIIWLWIVIAPVASALTFQSPHALRSFNLVVPLTIIVAAGYCWTLDIVGQIKNRFLRFIPYALFIALFFWQGARYLHQYYVHYPQTYPAAWEYGFKELVSYVTSVEDKYDRILITDKYDQPYILFLFYQKYPPQLFQNNHELSFRDKFNFSTVRDYSKYHFSSTPWEKVRDIHSALIVAAPDDIPAVGVNVIKTINFPNGQPAFKIISN